MYCSMTCKDKAMKVYHKYECFIIYHYHHNKDIFLTLRPFFFGLYIFDGDFNKMKSFFDVNNTIEGMKTVFDYDLSNPISEDYAMNLMTVFDSYKAKENNKLVQTEIKMIFESHNDLKAMWNGNEIIIVKMLSRYADILRELAHPIVQWPANTKQLINQLPPTTNQFQLFESNLVYKMVGVGYYPFLGLLNHSCVPNIYRHVNEKNQMMLIVCRPIQKGQQLFVDYK